MPVGSWFLLVDTGEMGIKDHTENGHQIRDCHVATSKETCNVSSGPLIKEIETGLKSKPFSADLF
jgi:hypothetical protein